MIKGKQPEEIRKLFNIHNDFTPEEEAQIRRENVRCAPHDLYRNGPRIARYDIDDTFLAFVQKGLLHAR